MLCLLVASATARAQTTSTINPSAAAAVPNFGSEASQPDVLFSAQPPVLPPDQRHFTLFHLGQSAQDPDHAGLLGIAPARVGAFGDDACFRYGSNTIWWGATTAALAVVAGATGGVGSLGAEQVSPLGWVSIGTGAVGAFTGGITAGRTALHATKCAN